MDKVLAFSKKIIREKIDKNSVAVDATCGNGNDTLFLAKTSAKKIYAFDVQQVAIERTTNLLQEHNLLEKCNLILDGHQNFEKYISEKINVVVFNLGYLPNANHDITTNYDTTLTAIRKFLDRLVVGGVVVVIVYWGHDAGKIEKDELLKYVRELDQKYVEVLKYQFINQKNNAPFLIALEKLKEFDSCE